MKRKDSTTQNHTNDNSSTWPRQSARRPLHDHGDGRSRPSRRSDPATKSTRTPSRRHSPLKGYGSKSGLAPRLLELLPAHKTFVEVFGERCCPVQQTAEHNLAGGAKVKDHPHPFPEELVKRVIKLFCYPGDLVLDPFVGSGTTACVAARLGCRYCGIDSNPDYCKHASERAARALKSASRSKSRQSSAASGSVDGLRAALNASFGIDGPSCDEKTQDEVKESGNAK